MSDFPKDGSTFVVESIDRTAYRWAKYKPDGARQMGKPGRWQKQVWQGDWFKWENCEEPEGEISPPVEDGPITKAFKHAGSVEHWRHEVGKLHSQIGKRDDTIRECLGWVRHWQADVAGNLKPTPDSLAMMEAKLVAILQPVEAPEAAE